jgi:DNA polymerase-3 subunit alpha
LGAVENVGHGPVEIIVNARGSKPFSDLNAFVRPVDLRKAGKRALESLIKVGALDSLGPRPSMLSAMDRIVSISGAHFKAADAGQMSLFGPQTGLVAKIKLPPASTEISRREQLNWERDLIGLYVSDHPLSPVMEAITQYVTHFAGELAEAEANQIVRVAGLITRVRPHTTKKGDAMGFVTIEDLQGNIELVIFPRTWDRYVDLIDFDNIILVEGKVDAQRGDPKVLVDKITTELTQVAPLEGLPAERIPPPVEKTDAGGSGLRSRGARFQRACDSYAGAVCQSVRIRHPQHGGRGT